MKDLEEEKLLLALIWRGELIGGATARTDPDIQFWADGLEFGIM
jgi:hypothetical protein